MRLCKDSWFFRVEIGLSSLTPRVVAAAWRKDRSFALPGNSWQAGMGMHTGTEKPEAVWAPGSFSRRCGFIGRPFPRPRIESKG